MIYHHSFSMYSSYVIFPCIAVLWQFLLSFFREGKKYLIPILDSFIWMLDFQCYRAIYRYFSHILSLFLLAGSVLCNIGESFPSFFIIILVLICRKAVLISNSSSCFLLIPYHCSYSLRVHVSNVRTWVLIRCSVIMVPP